jgi:hypothetical protein
LFCAAHAIPLKSADKGCQTADGSRGGLIAESL